MTEASSAYRLVRLPEVAAQLPVAIPTLRRWVRDGRVRSIRLGRIIAIPAVEVERLQREGPMPGQQGGAAMTCCADQLFNEIQDLKRRLDNLTSEVGDLIERLGETAPGSALARQLRDDDNRCEGAGCRHGR